MCVLVPPLLAKFSEEIGDESAAWEVFVAYGSDGLVGEEGNEGILISYSRSSHCIALDTDENTTKSKSRQSGEE